MPLIQLVVLLAVIGFLLWLANTYLPMQATMKRIMNFVVVLFVVIWLLSLFGLFDSLGGIRVGR